MPSSLLFCFDWKWKCCLLLFVSGKQVWSVYRRYSEFMQLHQHQQQEQVNHERQEEKQPEEIKPFPAKTWFSIVHDFKSQERRQTELYDYMDSLLRQQQTRIGNNTVILSFLGFR